MPPPEPAGVIPPELAAEVHIGAGPLRPAFDTLRRIAAADTNCLIWGESGTGKNLFAYLAHRLGPRRDGPYIEIGCASLPDPLIETELFGYVRGAFTGAADDHDGWLLQANGGTLVFDELDSLSLAAQAKLLRVVEQGRFTPMGGRAEIVLNTRFIGLTQGEPGELVRRGVLRQELYYRLALFALGLPPLRDDPAGFPDWLVFCIRNEARRARAGEPELAPDFVRQLARHPFPGNIRELQNLVRRWVLLYPGGAVPRSELPAQPGAEAADRLRSLAEVERDHIVRVLRATGGRKGEAAKILGIHRKTLLEKRRLYGLLPRGRDGGKS